MVCNIRYTVVQQQQQQTNGRSLCTPLSCTLCEVGLPARSLGGGWGKKYGYGGTTAQSFYKKQHALMCKNTTLHPTSTKHMESSKAGTKRTRNTRNTDDGMIGWMKPRTNRENQTKKGRPSLIAESAHACQRSSTDP